MVESIDKKSIAEKQFDSLSVNDKEIIISSYESHTQNETLSVDDMEVFYEWFYNVYISKP